MSIVVPSQVVEYIETRYPQIDRPGFTLGINHAPSIEYLLFLVESLPSYLVTLQGEAAAEFGEAVSAIRFALRQWSVGEKNYAFKHIALVAGDSQLHPIARLRKHLSTLQDEGAEPTTNELSFIADVAFRDALRRDLGAIDRCILNREWKAATVLGGSVVEALLLYALHEYEKANNSTLQSTIQSLKASRTLPKTLSRNLDEWGLHQLTEVSAAVSLIQKGTADECRIAKDFRNLIHPGKSVRLAQQCDRGTAFLTLAAVEHVIRDLKP